MFIPPMENPNTIRCSTPIITLVCGPAFGATLGAIVAIIDCFVLRSYLDPNYWVWQCRIMAEQDIKEALALGVAHGVLFTIFVIARTRLRATPELAMRCFGCGILMVILALALGAVIGYILGRFAPSLWGRLLPPIPPPLDSATFGTVNGTGAGGYIGAAAALALSCFLLHRRWAAQQTLASRGFPVLPATPPPPHALPLAT